LHNATLPYAVRLANLGWEEATANDRMLARRLNVAHGKVLHPAVAEALDLPLATVSAPAHARGPGRDERSAHPLRWRARHVRAARTPEEHACARPQAPLSGCSRSPARPPSPRTPRTVRPAPCRVQSSRTPTGTDVPTIGSLCTVRPSSSGATGATVAPTAPTTSACGSR